MRRSIRRCIGAAAVMTMALVTTTGTASAHGRHPTPEPLATGLVGPLGIAVTGRGDVVVAQAFAGTVSKVSRRGGVTDLVTEEASSFTPGVAATHHGAVLYTTSGPSGSFLKRVDRTGSIEVLADLGAYEATENPDQGVEYGVVGDISQECADEWEAAVGGPAHYTGIVDSNPYAIAVYGSKVYIADAAANAILAVDRRGRVRTVAVLPPVSSGELDQAAVDEFGLPQCVLGLSYLFEPVPTDVEVYRGRLYVSSLPGGPEGAIPLGGVWKVDPRSGAAEQIGFGLLTATDLAVSSRGKVYVTELFAGQVTRVGPHGNKVVANLDAPAAIEWARGKLYVATGDLDFADPENDPLGLGAGEIVTFRP